MILRIDSDKNVYLTTLENICRLYLSGIDACVNFMSLNQKVDY